MIHYQLSGLLLGLHLYDCIVYKCIWYFFKKKKMYMVLVPIFLYFYIYVCLSFGISLLHLVVSDAYIILKVFSLWFIVVEYCAHYSE